MAMDEPVGVPTWLAASEQQLPSSRDWLSPAEARRAAEMTYTKRRTEFLLRRWVGKRAVAALTGLPGDPPSLARVEVANRSSGAPVVVVDGRPAELEVSLSDRAGWAICVAGVTPGRLGCDLELVEPRSTGFVTDFLTTAERAYVAEQPAGERDLAATLVWSAKESALKVLETGLRRDSRSVDVVVGEPAGATGWTALDVRTAEGTVLPGWWRRAGSFLVTVAADASLPPPRALAGAGDLDAALPLHRWLEHPRSD
jgi:4'-phosphopantetheinyl transferase